MENKTITAEPLLLLIWKNRKLFILVGVTTVIISAIGSFMIPVKYKATCAMFPAKTTSLSLVERGMPVHGVELFGEEEEGERMLAILHSSALMNTVITKYDLFKHYGIDVKGASKNDQMADATREHIQFERTRYGSVNITVWDQNPDTCSLIANDLAKIFDEIKNKMIAEGTLPNYTSLEREYKALLGEVKEIEDTMTVLRKLGVVAEEDALAALLERQTIALQKGGKFAEEANAIIDNNQKYGSIYLAYYNQLEVLMERVEILKSNLAQLKSDINSTMSHKYIIDYAAPPDRKAYPVRWLVVAVSTVSATFLLLTLLVILQKIKQLKTAG